MKNGVVILPRNWVVILNWNQVLTLNWNWVVNITGICSLLRLKELGVPMDLNKAYLINRVLIGDHRENPPLKIDPTALYHNLINIK